MNWQRIGETWTLLHDGNRLAEVVCDDDGTWQWWRYTTIKEHGIPPASGREPSRREAMKRAATGIK